MSAVQWIESAKGIHISPPSWTPCPPGPHFRAPNWASCEWQEVPTSCLFTHGSVYMSILISQFIPSHLHAVSTYSFSTPMFLCLPCKFVHQYYFSRLHIYALIKKHLFFSFWLISLCMTFSRSTTSLKVTLFHSF